MSDDVVKRVALKLDGALDAQSSGDWALDTEGYDYLARSALSALRPGDELPGGLVVVSKPKYASQQVASFAGLKADTTHD